jgi:hypothetical protein
VRIKRRIKNKKREKKRKKELDPKTSFLLSNRTNGGCVASKPLGDLFSKIARPA